ncbi:ParA family protein [Burkholderia ubonensis]|uniref:ParA family protein n=1 Tax=Burkholderia ubonensis TaxID=101571 RepID=UPI000757C6EC|nr:ParA family protein [Burkholderia ubonensis]KVW77417.1 chromosome partitioning protein ParA [Burkholderia ubonensis]
MPVVVVVSPKGGVGKTTSALVLADQLARSTDVAVIDADPNKPIAMWAAGGAKPDRMTIISDADEENIIDKIEEAAAQAPFVIVDLEGTAAKIVILAVSQADLIIIPMQGSQLDASQASRALKVVEQQEKMSRRKVPYGVLLTRTSPIIRTRTMKHISSTFKEAGISLFDTELNEREAFKAMFSFALPLADLDPNDVSNLDKAIVNAEEFTAEVVTKLREGMNPSQEVA